ncbi:MAG TPA: aminotransferase class III-fold pyridoxal phosphate-dependent enzyme [Steroidobacteraceae bacterium]|nr:aminotransferase class III-fold pyridoxal phosphate-dependent enzyme [Steroidobacteraceae bacterium]
MSVADAESGARILARNARYIPGGISSVNRSIEPPLAFVKGAGAHLWDSEGRRYIDYHAAFAPHFLGHNFAPVNQAVVQVLQSQESLFGAGPSRLEGRLAELIVESMPSVDKVCLLNTGSEATALAVRVARAVTHRQHLIGVQGSYNGNADELACNVFNSLDEIGPRVSPGEYPVRPLGAGTTHVNTTLVHPINFNDLESVRHICRRYPVAAMITEPVLQNIGVVRPQPGYLAGLRKLADEFGFLLIFDEVKTGFRHALGGYSALCGVQPDLLTCGKAVANGFPLAFLGGRREYMDCIADPDVTRRPLASGTYNGHPVAVAAAIRTIEHLRAQPQLYAQIEELGQYLQQGLAAIFAAQRVCACIARQGSAFSFYFMEQPPVDFHDILTRHDFARDLRLRRALIERGVFFVPLATKQCSISTAHTRKDIDDTLERFAQALAGTAGGIG